MVQFTLKNTIDEDEPIEWKTVPFTLTFCESINAESSKEIQTELLSLAEIEENWANDLSKTKNEWETFVKANTLRMVYKVDDVPSADATSLGDTIFYLGANTTEPYTLTYGHYYRCVYTNETYSWADLTQDPNLADVANGIREINNNQAMQLWVGTQEELENEAIQPNTIYIPEDNDILKTFAGILDDMVKSNGGLFKVGDKTIPQRKLIFEGSHKTSDGAIQLTDYIKAGDKLEIWFADNLSLPFVPTDEPLTCWAKVEATSYQCMHQAFRATTSAVNVYRSWCTCYIGALENNLLTISSFTCYINDDHTDARTISPTITKIYKIIE